MKKCKESKETVQLIKFNQIWNAQLNINLNEQKIKIIGEDMIKFIIESFNNDQHDMLVFGGSFYYGYKNCFKQDNKVLF